MDDNEKIRQQLTFFDYIYPKISQELDSLKKSCDSLHHKVIELVEERKYWFERIDQYKNKIQRIEQFLIKNGLIKLLGKE